MMKQMQESGRLFLHQLNNSVIVLIKLCQIITKATVDPSGQGFLTF